MRVAYTRRAQRDLDAIYDRGLEWGEANSRRVEAQIRATCQRLGRLPELGARTDAQDVRRFPLVRYPFTIFYRIVEKHSRIEVLRIVHSHAVRNLGQVPD